MKFAIAVVVEADAVADAETAANEVWEDVSATLGDGNNLLEEGHSCVFVGDPRQVADLVEYDHEGVARMILESRPLGFDGPTPEQERETAKDESDRRV